MYANTIENTSPIHRLWNKYFILIFLIGVSSGLYMQMLSTTTALYVKSLGGGAGITGVILSMPMITSVTVSFFLGRLVDLKGRQTFIFWGFVIMAATAVLFRLLPYVAVLPVLTLLQGAGNTLGTIGTATAVTDVVPKGRLGEGVSSFGLAQTLTTAIGPALGFDLISGSDFHNVFYVAAGIVVAGILLTLLCDYEKKQVFDLQGIKDVPEETETDDMVELPDRCGFIGKFIEVAALPAFVTQLLFFIACTFNYSYISLYVQPLGIKNIGLFFAISAIGMLAGRLFSIRLADRVKPLALLIPGFLIGALNFVLLIFVSGNHLLLFVASAVYGLSLGIVTPVLNLLAIRRSPENRRGTASATYALSITLGIGLGGLLLGWFIDAAGFTWTLMLCATLSIVSAFYSIYFFRYAYDHQKRKDLL